VKTWQEKGERLVFFLDTNQVLHFNWLLFIEGADMKDNILTIHKRDNVAVALRTLAPGEMATAAGLEPFPILEAIPVSHKIAVADIPEGQEIIKYGETVAVSIRVIKRGEWVHTHNLESKRWKK
jgi:altronate dehydratase